MRRFLILVSMTAAVGCGSPDMTSLARAEQAVEAGPDAATPDAPEPVVCICDVDATHEQVAQDLCEIVNDACMGECEIYDVDTGASEYRNCITPALGGNTTPPP
jgi:hypothetical protein